MGLIFNQTSNEKVPQTQNNGKTERIWARPRSARTPDYEAVVEEMILSQEEKLGTHFTPRNIAEELSISHSSVCMIVREKNFKQF